MLRAIKIAVLASAIAGGGVAIASSEIKRPNPLAMSAKDIRLHNATLKHTDPQYIQCRRYAVTGTLAKKQRICLTNEVWAMRADRAQEWTKDTLEKWRTNPCGPSCDI